MIFNEQISRKPDLYPWTQDFIKAMHNGFWTSEEFSFTSDIQQFKTEISPQEQEIIVKTLSAIGQIEIAVKTYWAKLGENLPHPSIADLGYVMANVEVIHNNAYEKLLNVLGLNDIFEKNLKLDIISGRVNYLRKYNHKYYKDSKKQFIYSLILFTIFVENISLFSQFYIINWFNRFKNVLKDTSQQTAYTVKEELCHFLVGVKLINTIREEYPELFDKDLEDKIIYESKQALDSEFKIIDWIIGNYNEDKLNSSILKEYVKNRMNDSLKQIGLNKCFDVDDTVLEKTIWFDEEILGNNMSDFFHKKPTEYSKKSKVYDGEDLF